jgi:4-amino-4-deoxy-L-arabinose transferase-like glycosyltransferase
MKAVYPSSPLVLLGVRLEGVLARPSGWLIVFASFAVLRLIAALALDGVLSIRKTDLDVYDALARSLRAGDGFVLQPGGEPILWRPPLYPGFLALIWSIAGGESIHAVLVAQSLVDAATATLTLWVGRRLFGTVSGVLAGAMFCFYPLSAYYTLRVMPEPMLALGLVATVALCLRAEEDSRWWRYAMIGIVLGVTALAKPVVMYLPVALGAWLLWLHRDRPGRSLGHGALICLAFALTIMPWTIRNYVVSGEFVPLATIAGYSTWVGNRWESRGREEHQLEGQVLEDYLQERQALVDAGGPRRAGHAGNISPEDDRRFMHAAIAAAWQEPVHAAMMLLRKGLTYFWFDLYLPENRWGQGYVLVLQVILLSLALVGFLGALVLGREAVIVALPIGYLWLVHTLSIATLRYSIPLIPLLCVLAAFTVAQFNQRSRPGTRWMGSS